MNSNINLYAKLLNRKPTLNFYFIPKSFLGTTETCLDKNSFFREARILNKLMGKSSRKKKYWSPEVGSSSNVLSGLAKPTVGKQHIHRMKNLNVVFMKYVTDLLSSSDKFQVMVEKNVSITEVEIAKDLQFLKVYYTTSEVEQHEMVQAQLDELAFPLRRDLTSLNVIGNVPRIIFIQDLRNVHLNTIDRLLQIADYGEDFSPTNPSLFVGRNFPSSSDSSQKPTQDHEGKCENIALEGVVEASPEPNLKELQQAEVDQLMSLQSHKVFGIDQGSIMSRICASVQKAKAPHRKNIIYGEVEKNEFKDAVEDSASITERIDALKSTELQEFLMKRKKAMLKEKRLLERETNKRPHQLLNEAEFEEKLREEFAEDFSNFDYPDTKDTLR